MAKKLKRLLAIVLALVFSTGSLPVIVSADSPATGTFREDFGDMTVGENDLTTIIAGMNGIRLYDHLEATAEVVEDAGASGGKALYVDSYPVDGESEFYKSLTLTTENPAPDNFTLEYRFKAVGETDGDTPKFLAYMNATNDPWQFDVNGPLFCYDIKYSVLMMQSQEYVAPSEETEMYTSEIDYGNWVTVKISYYNGTYSLYANGEKIGSRSWGARDQDNIRFRIGTMKMYLDYIELSEYDGSDEAPTLKTGEFREDFGSHSVGKNFNTVGNTEMNGLKVWDVGFDAPAEVVTDSGADNGKALYIGAYESEDNTASDDYSYLYKSVTLHSKEQVPENFKLEYRFKVTEGNGGWPIFLNWLDAPNSGNGEGGAMFGYSVGSNPNYYLQTAYDNSSNEIKVYKDLGDSWNKVTITHYDGTYSLYVNEELVDTRSFGARIAANGYLHFKINTIDMYFDYIEVVEYDNSDPFAGVVLGEFEEDFGGFDVGDDDWMSIIGAMNGIQYYDSGFGATAEIVADAGASKGKALFVDAYPSAGSDSDTHTYKSLTLTTEVAVPDNFELEYRFKAVGENDGGWPSFLTYLNATNTPGQFDVAGAMFAYNIGEYPSYFLRSYEHDASNEVKSADINFGEWVKVKITHYNGTYTLYIDDKKVDSRDWNAPTEDNIRFRIGTMKMYIDYIKLSQLEDNSDAVTKAAVTFDKVGHIYSTDDALEMGLSYFNGTDDAVIVSASYEVKNRDGFIVQHGVIENITVSDYKEEVRTVALGEVDGTGIFDVSATFEADNGTSITKSTSFSRVFPVIADRAGEPFGTGSHYGHGAGDLTISPELQALGGLAMIRDDCEWQAAESTKGTIVIPQAWHNFVDAVMAKGIEPLLIFAYGNTLYTEKRGIPTTQEQIDAFVRFAVKTVDEFYPKGVRYFEVWNEPNNTYNPDAPFNPGNATPAQYAALVKATYEAVKAKYPDVKILAGSMAPFNGIVDVVWLEGMLKVGAADYMDVLSVHPYTYSDGKSGETANLVSWLERADEMIRDYNNGVSIPVWTTEIGWPTHEGDKNGVSEEVSASFMVRSFTQMLSLDFMEKLIWYDFQNDGIDKTYNEANFGTIRNHNDPTLPWGAKASYITQNVMANLLYKADYVKASTTNRQYIYQFSRADGKDVLVAWDTSDERTISLNVGNGAYEIYDMYGNMTTVQAVDGKLNAVLSALPIYIVGDVSGDIGTGAAMFAASSAGVDAAAGNTAVLTIERSAAGQQLSGSYDLQMPGSWTLEGDADFAASSARDVLTVNVPSDCSAGTYTVIVRAISGGAAVADIQYTIRVLSDPVSMEFVPSYADGEWHLKATIKNLYAAGVSGTVGISEPSELAGGDVSFNADANSMATVYIPVANAGQGLYDITITADVEDYEAVSVSRKTSFLRAQRVDGAIAIDGALNADEWAGAQEVVLDEKSQTRNGSSATAQLQDWGGEDDLSVKAYLKWDASNLYIGVEVKDDVLAQSKQGEDIWNGDSVQFTFDPGRAFGINSQGFNEIGMALTAQGVQTWRWSAANGSAGAISADLMSAAAVRNEDDGKTTYEAAVSWELLMADGSAPSADSLFGFSLLVNEDDGSGRRGWIQYMDGIGYGGKNPALFGDLLLAGGSDSVYIPPIDDGTGADDSEDDSAPSDEDNAGETTPVIKTADVTINGQDTSASVSGDGTMEIALDEQSIAAYRDESGEYSIDIKTDGITNIAISLPIPALQGDSLVIATEFGTITVSAKTLQYLLDKYGETLRLVITKGSFKVALQNSEGVEVPYDSPSNPMKISLPYTLEAGQRAEAVIAVKQTSSANTIYPLGVLKDGEVAFEITSSGTYDVVYNAKTFGDIGGHWSAESIGFVAARELFNGTGGGAFSPDASMTRAMFAAVLARLDGADLAGYKSSSFSDVPSNEWYTAAIEWAAQNGVVSGTGEGKFDPAANITREQMALMLSRYITYKSYNLEDMASAAAFGDADEISTWAKDAVADMQRAGIISGRPGGLFDPAAIASRGEVAAIFARFVTACGE